MPPWLLFAYARMRARLEAEEALAAISQFATGSGTMNADDQRAYLTDLRASARSNQRAPRASAATLAAIGITVKGGE